jgi:DNA-binding response OmpR family regulator
MKRALRILLIESDKVIAELMRVSLTDAGYTVQQSGEGLGADVDCDLVIADAPTPRLLAKGIGAPGSRTPAPVLLVSARFHHSALASSEIAQRLGVRAVLAKPFTVSELLHAVRLAIEGP